MNSNLNQATKPTINDLNQAFSTDEHKLALFNAGFTVSSKGIVYCTCCDFALSLQFSARSNAIELVNDLNAARNSSPVARAYGCKIANQYAEWIRYQAAALDYQDAQLANTLIS